MGAEMAGGKAQLMFGRLLRVSAVQSQRGAYRRISGAVEESLARHVRGDLR